MRRQEQLASYDYVNISDGISASHRSWRRSSIVATPAHACLYIQTISRPCTGRIDSHHSLMSIDSTVCRRAVGHGVDHQSLPRQLSCVCIYRQSLAHTQAEASSTMHLYQLPEQHAGKSSVQLVDPTGSRVSVYTDNLWPMRRQKQVVLRSYPSRLTFNTRVQIISPSPRQAAPCTRTNRPRRTSR